MALAFINCNGHHVNVDAIESYAEVSTGLGKDARTWVEVRTRSGETRKYRGDLAAFESVLLLAELD